MSTTLLCLGLGLGLGACERAPSPTDATGAAPLRVLGARLQQPADAGASGLVEFVHLTFEDLYPTFLVRKSMPLGEKSALWQRKYYGRWVRWNGTVRSVTPNGITVRILPVTTTFDVSLWMEASERDAHPLKRGDKIAFIGRLDSYDDVFRQMFLNHGSIVERRAAPPNDGGL